MVVPTCGLADGKTQTDGRIREAHDGCHNGKRSRLRQVGDLGEDNLAGSKDDAVLPEVWLAGVAAMEAV